MPSPHDTATISRANDSTAITTLKRALLHHLGEATFHRAYERLASVTAEESDDDTLVRDLQSILGAGGIGQLPRLLKLIFLEGNNLTSSSLDVEDLSASIAEIEMGLTKQQHVEAETAICAICTDEVLPGSDGGAGPPCPNGHRFHDVCMKQWAYQQRRLLRAPSCPMCRAPMSAYCSSSSTAEDIGSHIGRHLRLLLDDDDDEEDDGEQRIVGVPPQRPSLTARRWPPLSQRTASRARSAEQAEEQAQRALLSRRIAIDLAATPSPEIQQAPSRNAYGRPWSLISTSRLRADAPAFVPTASTATTPPPIADGHRERRHREYHGASPIIG